MALNRSPAFREREFPDVDSNDVTTLASNGIRSGIPKTDARLAWKSPLEFSRFPRERLVAFCNEVTKANFCRSGIFSECCRIVPRAELRLP